MFLEGFGQLEFTNGSQVLMNDEDNLSEKSEKTEKSEKSKKDKTIGQRFQRVELQELDQRLVDHSHASKKNDVWGSKADAVLSQVKGKDFRHEKTKKKRGTYKGGPITTSVNSIKFDD